jgi:ethanolaminephosphotransferase
MGNAASNYDVPRLQLGLLLSSMGSLGLILNMVLSWKSQCHTLTTLLGTSLFYALMMFGSSFVEEEHHFWYWTTTAWLVCLQLRK